MATTTQGTKTAAGIVNYNPNTGQKLSSGQSVTVNAGGNAYGSSNSNSSGTKNAPNPNNLNLYNPNTGQLLAPGQSITNQYTGQVVEQGKPFSSIIPATNMTAQGKPTLPSYTDPTTGMVNTINSGLANTAQTGLNSIEQEKQAALTGQDNNFAAMLKSQLDAFNAKPSDASIYAQAQRDTGILEKQKAVGDLTSQLNQITAQSQQAQLQVTGQGRGIPSGIIGGQQAEMARETAIASLPVAAQLAAAQGNLEMANQNLETLFKIKSADAKAKYDFTTTYIKSIYDYGDKQQQAKLADIAMREQRQYNEQQKQMDSQQEYAKIALNNNQSALFSKISALDIKSPTYKADLTKLQSQIYDPSKALDLQLKKAQIASANRANRPSGTATAPEVKSINGVDSQWNGKSWVPISNSSTTASSQKEVDKYKFLIKTAGDAVALSKGSGTSGVRKFIGGILVGDTQAKRLEALTNTIKTNMLTMATDPTIKKFFGPQMSNTDVELMTSAGTTLNTDLQSPTEYKDEANRVLDLFTRAQTAINAGIQKEQADIMAQNAMVIITSPENLAKQAGY